MDVRVWGVVDDRLVEVLVQPGSDGIRIAGLPDHRARTTADRVRAALINSGVVRSVPLVTVRLHPEMVAGTTGELDLPVALAVLARSGVLGAGLRWLLAVGRLGLDGAVYAQGVERLRLEEVVTSVCHSRVVGFEHVFETDAR
jgi:predicted ATPase with chaperone activity